MCNFISYYINNIKKNIKLQHTTLDITGSFRLSFNKKIMIIKKIYDEQTRTQKIWYDSSMLLYSEMVESETENNGDLYITFKNGTTYKYNNVSLEDYVLLIGASTDASHGKTLNKIIKQKYECSKIGDADVEKINKELLEVIDKSSDKAKTYFISGHRNITDIEFENYYHAMINYALSETNDAKFVVGDYYGVDIMAQNYLIDVLGIEPERITVYHMFDSPRNFNPKITKFVGGFKTDDDRDEAMTNASFDDIAMVRDCNELSGTAKNILRRHMFGNFV